MPVASHLSSQTMIQKCKKEVETKDIKNCAKPAWPSRRYGNNFCLWYMA
jgi:hypothetical protein